MNKAVKQINKDYTNIHSDALESQLIGFLIRNPDKLANIGELVSQNIFTDSTARVIFSELCKLKGEKVTSDYLASALKKRKIFDRLSESKIKSIIDSYISRGILPSGKSLKVTIYALKEMQIKRELLLLSQDLHVKVLNHEDVFEINNYATEKLANIYDLPNNKSKTNEEAFSEIEKEIESGYEGISSGYPSLDKIIYGFEPGDIIIVGGRPSMGKTAFGINIANNISKSGKRVVYISIEMTQKQLLKRLLSIETGIEINELRSKDVFERFKVQIDEAKNNIVNRGFVIYDDKRKIADIENVLRSEKLKNGVDVFIIDYVGLVSHSSGKGRTRENEVSEVSSRFKSLAKELGIPGIVLSQLNRSTEGTETKRPTLANLRESGSLEQDADTVILLHRPDYYSKDYKSAPEQDAEIIVAKGRNTGIGECVLNYKPYLTEFEEKNKLPI